MNNAKKIVKVLRGFIKTLPYRFLFKGISIKGYILASKNSNLEFSSKACVRVGDRLVVEHGTVVAARDDSVLEIGKNVYINRNCSIITRERIVLGNGVTIGPNCCIYDHDHDIHNRGQFITKRVIIGEDTWIGAGCIIVKGVTIGKKCVIAAGTIVTKDIPDGMLVKNRLSYVLNPVMEE